MSSLWKNNEVWVALAWLAEREHINKRKKSTHIMDILSKHINIFSLSIKIATFHKFELKTVHLTNSAYVFDIIRTTHPAVQTHFSRTIFQATCLLVVLVFIGMFSDPHGKLQGSGFNQTELICYTMIKNAHSLFKTTGCDNNHYNRHHH